MGQSDYLEHVPGCLSRVASKRGHFAGGGWLRVLLVARRQDKIRFRPDATVTRDRVPLNVHHLTLAERPLVAGLLQGRGPRPADRGQRTKMRARVGLEPPARQTLRQHSTVACRSRVGPRKRPSPPSPPELLALAVVVLQLRLCEHIRADRGNGARRVGNNGAPRRGGVMRTREHVHRRLPVDLARCFWRTGFRGHAGTSSWPSLSRNIRNVILGEEGNWALFWSWLFSIEKKMNNREGKLSVLKFLEIR